jgi:hypothetical protein
MSLLYIKAEEVHLLMTPITEEVVTLHHHVMETGRTQPETPTIEGKTLYPQQEDTHAITAVLLPNRSWNMFFQ